MRSARRKKRLESKAQKSGILFLLKLLVIPGVLLLIFLFIKINTKNWNGHDKLGFTYQTDKGDVGVTVADPLAEELTTFIIPGETEVNVARNYGTLRIKSVWQLSANEKLKGILLPETVMQNFHFPLTFWSDESGSGIGEGNIKKIVQFVFSNRSTNLPIGDRINLGLFATKVQSLGKTQINLGESQFLQKVKLNDGQSGYRVNGTPSERLTVFFSDNNMSQTGPKIYIVDETGETGVAESVGQLIEVLGGKVVSIDKAKMQAETDCVVFGKSSTSVKRVGMLFGCRQTSDKTDFDVEIRLGGAFAKRF